MVNIINTITIIRIILAAVIFVLLSSENFYLLALILFFIAGLSDYFDGFLARKYAASSQLGEILDPVADKILIVFLFWISAKFIKLSSWILRIDHNNKRDLGQCFEGF